MKSPLFQQQLSSGLNLSAVYEPRKSRTPSAYLQPNNGEAERQKEAQYNRSFVFDKELSKKQNGNLRSTIGSPTAAQDINHKKKMDNFLRNTSYFTINYSKFDEAPPSRYDHQNYKQTSSQKNTPVSSKKQFFDSKEPFRNFENKEVNYNKIMQKYDKKQKLIKELKKLSQIKISQKIKQTFEYEKGSPVEKGNQHYTDRIKININSPFLEPSDSSIKKIDLNKSTVNDRNKNEGSFHYLKEKILNKISPKDSKDTYLKVCSKNPEEQSKKSTYYTPKVAKSNVTVNIEGRFTPKLNTSKDLGSASCYLNVSDIRISDKNNSSVNNTSLSRQVNSPTIPLTKQSATKAKTMKDIREVAQLKKDKSSPNYFTHKKLTINDFELGKSLGEGKFGTVYQAIHKETRYLVALKKISKMSIKSNYMIDQFLLQVKIQSFCDHQNILKLFGCFDDKEHIYLVLEYMEDGTLFKYLKLKKVFSESEASIKLKQVAQAIRYLHQKGIAHRDIKPENIVISHGVGKLCDFGWAAICDERRKTYCGTFDYAAPEILEGVQYDMSVDLWCLGVLAYELMVGKAPFYHISRKETMKKILNVESTAIEFPPTMSKQAISFIQNLIRKRPQERMTAEHVLKHPFLQIKQQR